MIIGSALDPLHGLKFLGLALPIGPGQARLLYKSSVSPVSGPALDKALPGPQFLCNMHQRKCQNVVWGIIDIVMLLLPMPA